MELELIDITKPESGKRPEEKRKAVKYKKSRKRRRRRMKRNKRLKGMILLCELVLIILFCVLLYLLIRGFSGKGALASVLYSERRQMIQANESQKPAITEDSLTVNPYSRPGTELKRVNNIFVHYTANPGTSAAQNRSYFENLGVTGETSASAHFIIGYEGEIVQCIPLDEIGYAVKKRNDDSISIECCYLREDGKFTEETYQSLIKLSAWLLKEYKLTPEDMRRHYDEGGKKCPLYYVENEAAWEQFIQDLREYILGEDEAAA